MCFSGLFGKKKTTNTTTTQANPEAMQNYSYINNLARTAAQRPFQQYGTQASDFVAQMNNQQNTGIAGINAAAGSYQPYMDQATAATNAGMGPAYEGIQNYMSPYIQNVADTTGAMMRQQQEQAQSGALGTAAMSGAFGGDRAGIAAANLQQQNQMGYGATMANIMNQGYTQALGASQADLARQMAGGAQLAGLGAQSQQLGLAGGQAQLAAGTMQQQTEQAGRDALINQFMQEQGYPFQTAQFLANIYSMTGTGMGSTTTNTQQGSFWSDRRLKHDVERIGNTDDGQPIYRFKYNGSNQTQIGLMADDVEKHRPDAVGTDPKTGYKYVDYDRATNKAKGGGVAGPYQIEIGSLPGGNGYVSENYVKPGEMLLPDPNWIASVNQQNEDRKSGLQDFIDNIGKIKDTYSKFSGDYQAKADGGSVDEKKTPQELGYLQPILDAMKPQTAQPLVGTGSTSGTTSGGGGGGSTLGNILDAAVKVKNLFGLKDGGVAGGRHGYALDGGVHPTHWNPVTQKYEMEPAATEPAPVVAEPTGVVTPVTRPAPPMTTSNGVVPHLHPDQQPNRGIPLLTQADYGMSEPEFKNYTSHQYANPAEAAVGANDYYEGAGRGVGDAAAIENANRVYAGIKSGGEGLAPNELALYQHYKDKGFNDDTQIAGLIGRYNVEAGQGINPNARNTLGGGHGTYGIMQARGPRFEKLAAAGGLSPAQLEAMPVTNPTVSGGGDGQRTPDQQYEGGVKPYEDRNWLGQIFHEKDGRMNKDAMLSLLSGVGTMLASPSPFFLPTLGAGLAGAANTYMAREGQRSDITAQNLENLKKIANGTVEWNAINNTNLTPIEYAKAANMKLDPVTQGLLENMGGGGQSNGLTMDKVKNGFVTDANGVQIPFMKDYASLQSLVQQWGAFPQGNMLRNMADQAALEIERIEATGSTTGFKVDENGVRHQVEIPVQPAIQAQNQAAQTATRQEQYKKFTDDSMEVNENIKASNNTLANMTQALTGVQSGAGANPTAVMGSLALAIGIDRAHLPDFMSHPENYQMAVKEAALLQKANLDSLPGRSPAGAIPFTADFTPSPDMEPAAIRDIVIKMKANNDYMQAYYNEYPEWASKHPDQEMDIQAYQDYFRQTRDQRYQALLAKNSYEVPHFMGDAPPTVNVADYNALSNEERQNWWKTYEERQRDERVNASRGN